MATFRAGFRYFWAGFDFDGLDLVGFVTGVIVFGLAGDCVWFILRGLITGKWQ